MPEDIFIDIETRNVVDEKTRMLVKESVMDEAEDWLRNEVRKIRERKRKENGL